MKNNHDNWLKDYNKKLQCCTHREAANMSKSSLGKRDKYEYLTNEERCLSVKVKWAFEKQT